MTAESFFTATGECFDLAAERVGLRERDALIAGLHVRFRVAGDDLAEALLAGLYPFSAPVAAHEPDVTLSAFDTESGGEAPPAPPWSERDYLPRDEVRGFTAGRWRAAYSLINHTLWFYDIEDGRGVGWMRQPPPPESKQRAVPWWAPFYWALPANGRPLIHAAAVGGVLLVGPGGAGKSTTTYAAAAAGLPCAGDDYVALSEEDGSWVAHALYRWGRLDEGSLEAFPEARVAYRDDEKAGVELPGMAPAVPVRAVVVPRVAERTGSPAPVSEAEALRALAPSTLLQGPGTDPEVAAALGRLVRGVPTLALDVGWDIDRIPAAIEEAAAVTA